MLRSQERKLEWTIENSKLDKAIAYGWLNVALYFAPASLSGVNVCPYSTRQCRALCLNTSGLGGFFPSVQEGRLRRTREYLADPQAYVEKLSRELRRIKARADRWRLRLAVRPNATSDIPELAHALAERHPEIQFYDYTKIPEAWTRTRENYHLTFSRSETNEDECARALAHDVNVAVVFQHKPLQSRLFFGSEIEREVIDGDEHDLRFLDPRGVIVALKAKGRAKRANRHGFVVLDGAA